jgi:urease accessory protein
MTPEQLLAVFQLSDGLFPTGGFAHSFGLESYVHAGDVRDRASLEALLAAQLEGSAGPTDAVVVACASRWAAGGDLEACLDLDGRLDATRWVPEFRAASVQMGRQTLRVAAASGDAPLLTAFARAVAEEHAAGHHATVFGMALGCRGVEPAVAAAAYLHSTAVLLVNAALRLLPLGQVEAQCVLARARPRMARLAQEAAAAEIDALWSFTPGLEIAGLRHADLDARLFRS